MNGEKQANSLVLFKAGELISHLEVSATSIRRWVHRYPDFFSEASQIEDRYKVRYTLDDALLITTIQYLSGRSVNLDEIETQLREGVRYGEERVQELLAKSLADVDTSERGLNPKLVQLELKQVRTERDQALTALHQLEEKYTAKDQEVNILLREMAELKYELGIALGELNLRRQREQG